MKEFFTNIINHNNMDTLHYCPLCGKEVIKSETEGYAYQCPDCDEDFTCLKLLPLKPNNNIMQQVSELTISYKPKVKPSDRCTIRFSKDAYKVLMEQAFNDNTLEYKEYFKLILLNGANKVLGITTISEGGIDSSIVDVRLIMQTTLLAHSSSIILAHNHPAGGLTPSSYDDEVTKKIKEAAMLMDIKLYDHLIVARERYYSYADEGRL